MEILFEPTLFFQFGKGLILGLVFGWFISSLIYYRQLHPEEEE